MRTRDVPRHAASIIAILIATASLAHGQAGPGGAAPAAAPLDPAVDAVLTRMSNRSVSDLRAQVQWELESVIEEDVNTKYGEIWYKEVPPVPKFKVQFKEKVHENRKTAMNEAHMFDGIWYTIVDENSRTVDRREIRREGDSYNPYKLGEGAFPVPFGQKKEDIVREFDVAFAKPDPKRPAPEGTDHLRMTPRATSSMYTDYAWIDFWIQREGALAGLPVKVRAAQLKGTGDVNSYLTLAFTKIDLNSGFSVTVFEVETPPGYEVITQRLDPPPGSN